MEGKDRLQSLNRKKKTVDKEMTIRYCFLVIVRLFVSGF